MILNIVDFRGRKTEKTDKVIPYDSLKPKMYIDDKDGEISSKFAYLDFFRRIDGYSSLQTRRIPKDYNILLSLIQEKTKKISINKKEDDIRIYRQERLFLLNSFIKIWTSNDKKVSYQTDKVSTLLALSIEELIIIAIISTSKVILKNGFNSRNYNQEKKAQLRNIKPILLMKFLFESHNRKTLHEMIVDYVEGKDDLFFIDDENVSEKWKNKINKELWKKDKEYAFNKRDFNENNAMPLHILYKLLNKYNIFAFEMMRALSTLEKRGMIQYSEGIISIHESIQSKFDLNFLELIEDFLIFPKSNTAAKIVSFVLAKDKIACPVCGESLFFNKYVRCKKCNYNVKKNFKIKKQFREDELASLIQYGQILSFVNKKPVVFYLNKEAGLIEF